MTELLVVTVAFAWLLAGLGCWLGWQLLRQNGRILLRLDELEKRVDELEFGEPSGSPELRDEESPAEHSEIQNLKAPAATSRFGNHSLARSKINRDGLKPGTIAPDFRLPLLDGGELSLAKFRGHRVLLVFSDPRCGPCNALAPQLEQFHLAYPEVAVTIISRGDPKENRAKVKEYGLTFPVALQDQWEISRLYAMFATPIAYLIDEAGIIAADVAVGVEPILALMSTVRRPTFEPATDLQ